MASIFSIRHIHLNSNTFMKTIILSLGLIIIATANAKAQESSVTAFANSYSYETAQNYTKAIAEIEKVYSADSYSMNMRLGWLYYLSGDFQKSGNYYKNALKIEPSSTEARLGYAYPASALQNWSDVLANYKAGLLADPNNSVLNYRVAYILHYINKENKEALTYVQKALKFYPFDYDSHMLHANIQVALGNMVEARKSALTALQFNTLSVEAQTLYNKLK